MGSKIWTHSSSLLAKRANVIDQHIIYLCSDFLTLTVLLFWLLMWVTSNPFLYLVIWLVFALAIITAVAASFKMHMSVCNTMGYINFALSSSMVTKSKKNRKEKEKEE